MTAAEQCAAQPPWPLRRARWSLHPHGQAKVIVVEEGAGCYNLEEADGDFAADCPSTVLG
jgi:hypothetical protein